MSADVPEATSATTLMAISSAVSSDKSRACVASCCRSNVGLDPRPVSNTFPSLPTTKERHTKHQHVTPSSSPLPSSRPSTSPPRPPPPPSPPHHQREGAQDAARPWPSASPRPRAPAYAPPATPPSPPRAA